MKQLKDLVGMIESGSDKEKTELLHILTRGLAIQADKGDKAAQDIMLEAARYAAGMVACPKCNGTGETRYIRQYYYLDGTPAAEFSPEELDECLCCETSGYVDKNKMEVQEMIKSISIEKPAKVEGTCPKCQDTRDTKYKVKLFFLDGSLAGEDQEGEYMEDECRYCI